MAGIWISFLSPSTGLVNEVLVKIGMEPIPFMTSNATIRPVFIFLNIWKTAGYGCVIMLAALTSIDPNLYEAAMIDGANRFKQHMAITIPSLFPTIKVVFLLNLIINLRMFTSVQVLINGLIQENLDVAMTFTYREGIRYNNLSYASAASFFVLLITLSLTLVSQYLSRKENT